MKTLRLTVEDKVATLCFNRPDNMNTLNQVMADELITVTEQIQHDKTIKVLVLEGAGSVFMAGGDIDFFNNQLATMPAGVATIVRTVNAVVMNLINMPQIVLACVQGAVAGIGVSFMLAADLVLANSETQFTLAYSKIATSPDGGVSFHLPRLVGKQKAMELLLLSERFSAEQAQHLGLVNWVASDEGFHTQKEKIIQRLRVGPSAAFARHKALVNASFNQSLAEQCEAEAAAFAACSETENFSIGIKSFLAKKKAEFID